jgi:hypothetical protein
VGVCDHLPKGGRLASPAPRRGAESDVARIADPSTDRDGLGNLSYAELAATARAVARHTVGGENPLRTVSAIPVSQPPIGYDGTMAPETRAKSLPAIFGFREGTTSVHNRGPVNGESRSLRIARTP